MDNQFTLPFVDKEEVILVIKQIDRQWEYMHEEDDDDSWSGKKREKRTMWESRDEILGYVENLHELEVLVPRFSEISKRETVENRSLGLDDKTKVKFKYQKYKRFDAEAYFKKAGV